MDYIIYINNHLIRFDKDVRIRRTLQVNDISQLRNRQSSLTNNLKVPKTSENVEAFNFIGEIGNTSNFQYKKIPAKIITKTGIPVVNDGWCTINSIDENYINITIYDGYINFYNAVSASTFESIDISSLDHLLDVAVVKQSVVNDYAYQYLFEIFGGIDDGEVDGVAIKNIDYQIPFVSVNWLFNRIMSQLGFTFSGDIFNSDDFTDLYISYPDGLLDELTAGIEFNQSAASFNLLPNTDSNIYANIPGGPYVKDQTRIDIIEDCAFRITFDGYFDYGTEPRSPTYILVTTLDDNGSRQAMYSGFRDSTGVYEDNYIDVVAKAGYKIKFDLVTSGSTDINAFNYDFVSDLYPSITGRIDTRVKFNTGKQLRFNSAFSQLKPQQFISELLIRFGLTPITKENNHIKFITIKEWLNSDKIDWSSKFIRVISEKTTPKGYNQNNTFDFKKDETNRLVALPFRYKEKGNIFIDDENLSFEEKNIFTSKTYAVKPFFNAGLVFNVYNKEKNDDGAFEIKSDNKNRFHFVKRRLVNTPLDIGSLNLNTKTNLPYHFRGDYSNCGFDEIVNDYYLEYQNQILNNYKEFTIEVMLNEVDYINFEFDKIYFFKQLGSNFIINNMKFIDEKTPTRLNLIKIDA